MQEGDRFGFLVVEQIIDGTRKHGVKIARKVSCRCDCGNIVTRDSWGVSIGRTISCGCKTKALMGIINKIRCTKHGQTTRTGRTSEYRTWAHMKQRCLNPNDKNYNRYGGRGIKICEEWITSFENFFQDVGEKPEPKKKYSLDRVNNDGNYEPGNVRWVTQKEQVQNSSIIKPKIKIICLICKTEKFVQPSLAKNAKYCSNKCRGQGQKNFKAATQKN